MRLIDADELKIDYGFTWSDITPTHDELYELINRQPTIDAVQVVRCGECVYLLPNGRCLQFADDSIRPSASDYCSYGERKVEGNE